MIFFFVRLVRSVQCWFRGHMFCIVKKSTNLQVYECENCYTLVCYLNILAKEHDSTTH